MRPLRLNMVDSRNIDPVPTGRRSGVSLATRSRGVVHVTASCRSMDRGRYASNWRHVVLVFLFATALLSGCRSSSPRLTGESDGGGIAQAEVESTGTFEGKVVAVADGDTITVLRGHDSVKVRLYGVDAPESGDAFSNVSKRFTSEMVFGKTVRVEGADQDRYGRLIARVTLADGRGLSQELVRSGCAWWYRRYAPSDGELDRLEAEARLARRGLWSDPNPVPPWESRAARRSGGDEGKSSEPRGLVDVPAEGAPVIGNRRSMVYHRRDCPDYARVSEKNRVPFKDQAEAEAAGYRKAGNCP